MHAAGLAAFRIDSPEPGNGSIGFTFTSLQGNSGSLGMAKENVRGKSGFFLIAVIIGTERLGKEATALPLDQYIIPCWYMFNTGLPFRQRVTQCLPSWFFWQL